MKKLSLIVVLFCLYFTTTAQVSTYTFSYSSGVYTPLVGGTALVPQGSGLTGNGWFEQSFNVPLPFIYYFNGYGFSSLFINSNGYVTFGKPTLVTNPRPHLVNNGQTGAVIGYGCASTYGYTSGPGTILLGGLLDFPNANPITYGTIGSAPNRIFVVQWTNAYRSVSYYPSNGTAIEGISFQIRLKEGTNVAEIVYNASTTNFTPIANPQAGLSGSSTVDFNLVSGANWTSVTNSTVANGVNIPWTPSVSIPAGTTFTFTPPGALQPVACAGTPPAPTVLSNIGITNSTATLSLSGLPLATGLTFQWQSSATGLANSWSNIAGATNFTYTATPTAATYYQCLVACGAGAPVTSTSVGIGYESAYPGIGSYTYNLMGGYPSCQIGAFSIAGAACGTTFNDISNSVSGYNYTTYAGTGGTMYTYLDYTSTINRVKLQGSTSSPTTFTASINNIASNAGAYNVWIDFNDNGLFTDPGENVGSVANVAGVATAFNITIPANNFGIHRMRIRGAYSAAYGTAFGPTGALSFFGQAIDYAVEIVPPTPTATSNSPVCVTGVLQLNSAALSGPPAPIYTWSGPLSYYSTTTSTTQNYTVPSTAASGTYTLSTTVDGANACTNGTTVVSVVAQPIAAPTNDGPICNGGTANLLANATLGTGPYNYSWSGPNLSSTTIANPTASPTATATYSVTVSNAATGCSNGITYTTTVTVNPKPTAAPTNDGPICNGGAVNFAANPGGGATSFTWSGPNMVTTTGASPSATPTVTSVYSLTVSSGGSSGCSPATVYTTSVTVNAKPSAAPTNNGPSCTFGTINLTANPSGGVGAYLYNWSGAFLSSTTVANPTATPGSTSTYTLTVSNAASGCSSAGVYTTTAVVNSRPSAAPFNNGPMCIGGTANLTANPSGGFGPYIYTWSGPNLSSTGIANPTATPTATATYSLTVTNAAPGCNSGTTYTTTVTVNPKPTAAPTNDGPICVTGTVNLTANATGGTGTYLYNWSGSNLSSTTIDNPTATPTSTGTYLLTVTNAASGCNTGISYPTTVQVNPQPTATPTGSGPICVGGTENLFANPSGGVGTYIYSWAGSDLSSTVINNPTATPSSSEVYSLSISNAASGCNTGIVYTLPVDVYAVPSATPSNDGPICIGGTVNLAANATDGFGPYLYNWSGPSLSSSTVSNPTATPTTTVTYTLTVSNAASGCSSGIEYNTNVVVNLLPASITGPNNVCEGGSTITLNDADAGGTWTSSNANATVNPSSGFVTGVTAGTATITYTLTTGCTTTYNIVINPLPASITGTASACVGQTVPLADATPAGTWNSSNAHATVGISTGFVTGVSAGNSTISYTLPTGCYVTADFTVNPLPSAITGAAVFCQNTINTLSDVDLGGTWSSTNTFVAPVNPSTGDVTGVLPGTAGIIYTLPTGCSIAKPVTVNVAPDVSDFNTPTAPDVCVNTATTVTIYSATLAPGTYTVTYDMGGANTSFGNVTTLTMGAGTGTFSTYILPFSGASTVTVTSVTNALTCNTLVTGSNTGSFTVNPLPLSISGTLAVCKGLTTPLSDAGGGTWNSSNPAVASIDPSGLVTGNAAGNATITYTLPTGCKTSAVVTVNPLPAAVTGAGTVCVASSIPLNDATFGGSWSSSNVALATVGISGIVTGVSAGSPMITYTLPTGCIATKTITVNPLPLVPATITGTTTICVGANTALSDAVPGGIWSSSSTAVATITPTGLVTGITSGTTIITYAETNSCGTALATTIVTVNPLPVTPWPIGGTTFACIGSTTMVTDITPGGTWTSSNPTLATVDPSGVVTGLAVGMDTIRYTMSNSCGSASVIKPITVNPMPNAGTITGSGSVCVGATINLADSISGGTWISSSSNATINSMGVVTGVTAGTDTIKYIVPNICGLAIATKVITINADPDAGTISGPADVCVGATITLSDPIGGGVWTSSNTTAGVTSTGIVSGLTQGTDTIRYTLTSACGSYSPAIKIVNVHANPNAYPLTGGGSYCPNADGVHIGLIGSQTDVNYQLYKGLTPIGTAVPGTGIVLDFGLQTDTGTYTVVGVNPSSGCTRNMAGNVHVTLEPIIVPQITINSYPVDNIEVGQVVRFTAVVTNGITAHGYQWYINQTQLFGDTTAVFENTSMMLYNNDTLICVVKGIGPCGENYGVQKLVLNIHDVSVTQVNVNAADIKVTPNPSKGNFTIKGTMGIVNDEEVAIEITDVLGQVVYRDRVMTVNGNINTSVSLKNSMANGMYLLNLRSGSQNKVFHIVLEQ